MINNQNKKHNNKVIKVAHIYASNASGDFI